MKAQGPYVPAGESGDGMGHLGDSAELSDIWQIFSCRRRTIYAVIAVCMAAAIGFVVLVPPQYSATAEIFVDPRDRQILAKDVNPDTLAADGGLLQIESQVRVVSSDSVLLRAVDSAGLASDPEFGGPSNSGIGALIATLTGDTASGPGAQRNKALRALRKNLTVKRADKVFVIDVTVSAKSADEAARVSDAVAEAYIADQVAARRHAAESASGALEGQLADLRNGVRKAENDVEAYKAAHDIVGTNRELVTDQQLDDSQAKLANAHTRTQELRARLEQIERIKRDGGDPGSIPEALQSSVITQLRAAAQDLLRRESDLRTRVGERHPDLIALVEQVQEVKRQINAELDRLARSARADYDRALTYEHSLNANFDRSKAKTETVDQDSVELHELTRELDARRSLYQAFLSRAAETRAQADINTLNARIISKAIPPSKASSPPRPVVLIGALAAGLGLGAGLALLLEYFAPTVLSAGQLEHLAEAPVIGVFRPTVKEPDPPRGGTARRRRGVPDHDIAMALSRLCGPIGALRGTPQPYCLVLTSAPGDTRARQQVMERIVATAEERSLSVLVADASGEAAGRRELGFLDVVNGDCGLRVAVQAYGRHKTKWLPAGRGRHGGAAEITQGQTDRFIEEAGRYFDLILFDAGAFEENPGLAPLAVRAGDVLFVAVKGVTLQKAARITSGAVLAASGQPVSASLLMQAAA